MSCLGVTWVTLVSTKAERDTGEAAAGLAGFTARAAFPANPHSRQGQGPGRGKGRPTETPLGSRETDTKDGPQGNRKNQQTHLTEDAPATPLAWNLSVAEPGVLGSDPVLKTGDPTAKVCFYGRDCSVHLVSKYTQMR